MTPFKYPGSDYDNADALLALIGSFWSDVFQGNDLVSDLLYARAQLNAQSYLDTLDLVASCSFYHVPVFHRENWHLLTFNQSEVNNFDALMPYYKNQTGYYYDGKLQYGVIPSQAAQVYCVPAPDDLRDVKVIMNRITSPSLTLIKGIDFWLPEPGVLALRQDPFSNPLTAIQELFSGNTLQDRIGGLWLFHGDYDWDTVYEQFGYALRMRLASSEGAKALVVAVLSSLIQGPTATRLNRAWSAITDVPLTLDPAEVVEVVTTDIRSTLVITDKHAYKFALGSTPVVKVGDTVHAGDPLVDTLMFYEFNRGQVSDDLTCLAVGPGILANGYWGSLVFENQDVPLVTEYDEQGKLRVSFELGGNPADVEAFWDTVHANGISQGKLLAELLDQRANPDGPPLPESLPATINPLKFLCANLFRYHVFAVKVRTKLMGQRRLGLAAADYLRKIVPPEKIMIVLVELEYADEPIKMEGPGDEQTPGYTESILGMPVMTAAESIDGIQSVVERVRLFQVKGKCE